MTAKRWFGVSPPKQASCFFGGENTKLPNFTPFLREAHIYARKQQKQNSKTQLELPQTTKYS
jgi:hypothetical protein